MYIIYLICICFFIKSSISINFYAGINFNLNELPSDFPLLGKFYNKLYFFYSNTVVDNGDNRFDDSYKPLDSIASGLSLYTDPIYDLNRIPPNVKNKHLLGTLESYCYVLALFVFYPRFNFDSKYNNTHLFPYLFNRCMNLNHNFTNYKVDLDFADFLVKTETQLDDVYLFEKFSRMFPRPCYLDKKDIGICTRVPNMSDLDLVNEFVSKPGCYFNDFFQKECVSYSKMKRKTLNSFKSLFQPDANLFMYSDKWSYLYMPKRYELELSMDNLSYLLFLKVVRNGETKNCKEIQELISAGALKNLSVKYVIGRVDFTSEETENTFNLSFGLTFKVDQFRANNINRMFDFLIKNVDFDTYYDVLLGADTPLKSGGLNNDDELKDGEKGVTLRDRYNKYMEPRLNKYKIKHDSTGESNHPDQIQNKFEFLNMKGLGQHREVTFSVTLNPSILRKFRPVNSNYYLKLTHMLDTGVYIDNDELQNVFGFVDDESSVFTLPADQMVQEGDKSVKVKLRLLSTPYVDIEQPEMNSSPVIYHGYVVLDESVVSFKKLVVTYTMTIHTRYMSMHKKVTPELDKVDNLRLLNNQMGREYSMVMVAEPNLYVWNPFSRFESVPLEDSYLMSLRFLSKVSFNNFARSDASVRAVNEFAGPKWVPVPLTKCNNSNVSLKLCQGFRTGLAVSTRVINTYFCNPIIKEMGGDVMESGCYLVFSVPIGNQYEYRFISNVTLSVIFISCIVSSAMVIKYMSNMAHKVGSKEKET